MGQAGPAEARELKEILDVNLMSYVFCAKAAVPLMRRNKGGAIVNVASVLSVVAGGSNQVADLKTGRIVTADIPEEPPGDIELLHGIG